MTEDERPQFGASRLWVAVSALDALIVSVIAHPRVALLRKSNRDAILLLLLAKGIKTYRATLILCKSGYGQDGVILVRSLFELVVSAQYLVQTDSRTRVARYVAYNNVLRAQLPWSARPRRIQSVSRRAKARFKFSGGAIAWAGVTLEQAAKAVGQGPAYDSMYRLSSQFQHSMPWAVSGYGQGGRADISPSQRYVNQTLGTALMEVVLLIEVINRVFRLGLRSEIRRIRQSIQQLAGVARE